MSKDDKTQSLIDRRALGMGVAGLALAAMDGPAVAASRREDPPSGRIHSNASPVTTTLASAPKAGYIYRYFDYHDFVSISSFLAFDTYGYYPTGAASNLRATCEIPAGCFCREVEWYVYNNGGSSVQVYVGLTTAGVGSQRAVSDTLSIANTGGSVTATNVVIPQASYGPYPQGSKLVLSALSVPTDRTIQINGARVAFSNGNGTTSVRPLARVYDTRETGGILASGEARTININPQPGVVALILSITIIKTSATGYLKAYATGTTPPTGALLFSSLANNVSGTVTVPVSADGRFTVAASTSMHITIDIVGSVA